MSILIVLCATTPIRLQDQPDPVRISRRILMQNLSSVVLRHVIPDDDLKVEGRLLREYAVKALLDVSCVVVGNHANRNLRFFPGQD